MICITSALGLRHIFGNLVLRSGRSRIDHIRPQLHDIESCATSHHHAPSDLRAMTSPNSVSSTCRPQRRILLRGKSSSGHPGGQPQSVLGAGWPLGGVRRRSASNPGSDLPRPSHRPHAPGTRLFRRSEPETELLTIDEANISTRTFRQDLGMVPKSQPRSLSYLIF